MPMCEKCRGIPDEEIFAGMYDKVSEHGFTLMCVGSGLESKSWVYTIGLSDGYNHPEMVIAGCRMRDAADMLMTLASCVIHGDRVDMPGEHTLSGTHFGVVPVHRRQLDSGLMAMWEQYYEWLARFDVTLDAVQIVLPSGGQCWHRQTDQPDLSGARHVRFDGLGQRERRGMHSTAKGRSTGSRPALE